MNQNERQTDSKDIDLLISRYFDGILSEAELTELEDELLANEQTRDRLRQIAMIEEGLSDFALDESELSEKPSGNLPQETGYSVYAIAMAATFAAIVSGLATFIALAGNKGGKLTTVPGKVQTDAISNQHYVAHIIDKFDAEFEGLPLDDISNLQPGDYTLLQGFISLQFKNGAATILEAPAKFSLENDNFVRISDGNLRVLVPPSGEAFRVSSPGVEFHNFGSEFGIRANSATGFSEINVFQGAVNSKLVDSGEVVKALVSGQAAVYRDGVVEFGKTNSSAFIAPGQIGYKRWERSYTELQNEPEMIGYFPFVQNEPGIVQNFAQHPELSEFEKISDGAIGAATWVEGRWPSKRALMFESTQDYFEITFPNRCSELTIATWLKLDRLSNSYNVILNSNGWREGAVHFQLNRTGCPWISTPGCSNIKLNGRVPLGKWFHLVATISTEKCKAYTYLNGRKISETDLAPNTILLPRQCRIGNWLDLNNNSQQRSLNGRMDELMIWKKALTSEEIKRLVNQGVPRRFAPPKRFVGS